MANSKLIDDYCAVWSEPDPGRRAELLDAVWADGATYTDPTVHASGADELLTHIGKVQATLPGCRVVRTSRVDEHHRIARFAWRAIEASGNALPEGLDVAFLSADGTRIEGIIGFFGPTKPKEQ